MVQDETPGGIMGNQALQDKGLPNITINMKDKWSMVKEISFPYYVLMIY